MARQAKPYEEARKGAEAFFRGDSLRTELFLSRYTLRAEVRILCFVWNDDGLERVEITDYH